MTDTQSDDAGVGVSFIRSLWSMLADSANADIIAWLPDGASFCIIDAGQLEARVLSQYFATSKVTSFVRQLSAYGFVSARAKRNGFVSARAKGADSPGYKFRHDNDLFRRDQPLLAARIARYRPKRPSRANKRWHSSESSCSSSETDTPPPPRVVSLEDERQSVCMQLEAQHRRIALLKARVAELQAQLLAEDAQK